MQINHPTTLTFNDHAQLERLMCTLTGRRSQLAALVRRKLETAVIIVPHEAPADLVTSGRQVRYSVDGTQEAEGILSWDRPMAGDQFTLFIQEARGLALLGLRVGQSISVSTDGEIETIAVEEVSVPQNVPLGRTQDRSPTSARSTVASWLRNVSSRFMRHAAAALRRVQKGRTEAALMRLSDDTLRDIGITRDAIPQVASMVASRSSREYAHPMTLLQERGDAAKAAADTRQEALIG